MALQSNAAVAARSTLGHILTPTTQVSNISIAFVYAPCLLPAGPASSLPVERCSQLLRIEFVRDPCWRMPCQLSQHRSIRQGAQLLSGGRGALCIASGRAGCSFEVSKQLQESQQLSCCAKFGHFEAVTVVSINILQEG